MNAPVSVTYRNGFQDRLAFAAYHIPRNPFVLILTIGIFLFFTFESVLPAARALPADRPAIVGIITFVLVELLLVFIIVAFWTVIVLLTMISRRNKPLYCERTLTAGDEVFVTESQYGRSETRWSLVQKLARTRSHIIMYTSQENAVVVPRSAFDSSTQWDAFYEICRQRTSGVA